MTPAVIALIGTLFSAAVTFVGLLFKRSVDERTVAIAQRADQDRIANERRLQMDAAMRTVQLLTLGDGKPASLVQSSTAVLMLAELGETQLALALVRELWPKEQISSSAAVRVIDDALALGPVVQRTAANTLLANVYKIEVGGHEREWPTRLDEWDSSLDVECRYAVALALLKWLRRPDSSGSNEWALELLRQMREQETDHTFSQLALPAGGAAV